MPETSDIRFALDDNAARQLATTTKSVPQMEAITPRWLVRFLPWIPVEAGTYRINRVKEASPADASPGCGCGCVASCSGQCDLPETFVDYQEKPQERTLSMVSTVLNVHTRVSDLFSSPHDQLRGQLRLTIEYIKEQQERELINNADFGLLPNVVPSMRVKTRKGPPTPDDMDELIARVWKEPAFFLAHPRAIAAVGRECTRRGVPPPTVTIFGVPFNTWRGLPLVPCDKLELDTDGRTNILLMRTGAERQGVAGLFQPNLPGEQSPGLSVRFMGINRKAIASYLVTLYFSVAIHTDDALGVLEDVAVDHYHEYA